MKLNSKKSVSILLVLLTLGSVFSSITMVIPKVYGNSDPNWPGSDLNNDGKIDIYDAVEYMRTHYLGFDPIACTAHWSFSNPNDVSMANRIIEDSLKVDAIRNKHKDDNTLTIVGKALHFKDINGIEQPINTAADAAGWMISMIMKDKAQIMAMLHPALEWICNNAPDVLSPSEATTFESDFADYMVQIGEEWATKVNQLDWSVAKNLKFDTSVSSKLAPYAGKIKIVFFLGSIVDKSIKHALVVSDIQSSDILDMIKAHEYRVEVLKWFVDAIGKTITDSLANIAAAKGAAALMAAAALTANPAIIIGTGVVGYVVIETTLSDMLSAAWNWVEDEATTRVEVLRRLNPLYKYIDLQFTGVENDPINPMRIKIVSIVDTDKDYIIPWGHGKPSEDIEVTVENTGARNLNLRTTPTLVPANWEISDKEWLDIDNYVEFSLKVGEIKKATFQVTSYTKEYHWYDPFHWDGYTVHQGENPGLFGFDFVHDEHTDWWDIGDWFPGGIKSLFTDSPAVTQYFYNSVDFEVSATPEKTEYFGGETATVTITVKNCRSTQTQFSISVMLRDPYGDSDKYDNQISIFPDSQGNLDPEKSADFTVTWSIPLDAVVGDYQIKAVLWEDVGNICRLYISNLEWQPIFSVTRMCIVWPTASQPADAGDNTNPQHISAFISGLPSRLWIGAILGVSPQPSFKATIGSKETVDVTIAFELGGFGLIIVPPPQDTEGVFDLTISVTSGDFIASACQLQAVKYGKTLSTDPIQKGLAWLRARQGDGSGWGDVGVRSLELLAFLNSGYDETDSYVSSGVQFLLANVHGGAIYNEYWHATYQTSLAMLALIATHNDNYRTTIENAKNWLVSSQWDESCIWGSVSRDSWYYGGFGYGDDTRPDLSNTQFALLALDAAGLPQADSTWAKVQVFLHRCQKVNYPITLTIDGTPYTVQPWNYAGTSGGYDGGFLYVPGSNAYLGGAPSMGAMTGAGIWGLLLSGVSKNDQRVTDAINWVVNHYTWDTNPNSAGYRRYYYYLSLAKALTMYGQKIIGGHDWYQDLYNKITSEMITVGTDKAYWAPPQEDYVPDLPTAYAILSLQTRAVAPTVQRLSYLTFILRSNCLIRIIDSDGNLVGYNYMTGMGENNIPTAIYSGPFSEPQYVVIVNPKPGTYKLELVGVSEGPYTLTIRGNYGEEVTKTFEYTSEISPAELQGSQVTVTAIVGPIDIYANPPEFEKIIDNIPPKTTLTIGNPQYTDGAGKKYVTSATPLTLTAEDNVGGTGVASTHYRVYNTSGYDTGMQTATPPIEFYLTGVNDGEYSIDFYSVDNIGNIEATITQNVTLDNTPPTTIPTIGDPKYISGLTYVTPDTPFTLTATDAGSGVKLVTYRINSTSYDSGWLTYSNPFSLSSLGDGNYTITFNSTDNVGNVEATHRMDVTLFSWNYVFKDSDGRGTTLKICTAYKFFQFIAPDKDFGVKYALKMIQCKQVIIICYADKQMCLAATAVDNKNCAAIARDKQTCKTYLLIEHPPSYTLTVYCQDKNGKPISGVSIYINGCFKGKTDASGKLAITNIPAGTYTVTAKKCGYKDTSISVTISSDTTITITMK